MDERNHSAVRLAPRVSDTGLEVVSEDAAGLGDRPAANGMSAAANGNGHVEVSTDVRSDEVTTAAEAVPSDGTAASGVEQDEDGVYQQRLGARLRAVRRGQRLRLQDVEHRSAGRFKAVVIGSYERGDRAVSAHKLAALAAFYGVPIAELLPEDDWPRRGAPEPAVQIAVDRVRVTAQRDPALAPLGRLVQHVQWLRGDYNGAVLSLRGDDLRTVAVALGVDVDGLEGWLEERDLLAAAG